jgi:hypothetical protein
MNWKGSIRVYFKVKAQHLHGGTEKTTKGLSQNAGLLADNRTWDLPDTRQECQQRMNRQVRLHAWLKWEINITFWSEYIRERKLLTDLGKTNIKVDHKETKYEDGDWNKLRHCRTIG